MTIDGPTEHVDPEELVEYLEASSTGGAPEARHAVLEAHLTGCSQCRDVLRRMRAVAAVLDGWTAEAHGAAFWLSRMQTALDTLRTVVDEVELRGALEAWSRRLHRGFAASLASRLGCAEVGMAGAGMVRMGLARPLARVSVREPATTITVELCGPLDRGHPPVVLLVSADETQPPRLSSVQPPPGGSRPPEVCFAGLPSGEYLIALDAKISTRDTVVELVGDEMARVVFDMVKEQLVEPFVDLKLLTYDLGLAERDRTCDRATLEAAQAIERHRVAVKCPTITPDAARVEEYGLRCAWPSANQTLRRAFRGVVFRAPIRVGNVWPLVRAWQSRICVAREACGDHYGSVELRIPGPGTVTLTYTPQDGEPRTIPVQTFAGPGAVRCVHEHEESFRLFARACIEFALQERMDLWFSANDNASREYHGMFKRVFAEEVAARQADFDRAFITYTHMLSDEAMHRAVRHSGDFVWACPDHDGDLASDLVGSGFGGLGLMTSVQVSPRGHFVYEALHGTLPQQYQQHLRGEPTSITPTAAIFAWTGAMLKRSELDGTPNLQNFALRLQEATVATIEAGVMTRDIAEICEGPAPEPVTTEAFVAAVADRLRAMFSNPALRAEHYAPACTLPRDRTGC